MRDIAFGAAPGTSPLPVLAFLDEPRPHRVALNVLDERKEVLDSTGGTGGQAQLFCTPRGLMMFRPTACTRSLCSGYGVQAMA